MFKRVDFEEYDIASTAFMFILDSNINIDLLFLALYVDNAADESSCRDTILGAKYKEWNRGRVSKKGCMKNTILVEMVTDKRLSIKINLNKIHVCGTKSMDDARYAAQIIVQYINEVYEFWRTVQLHHDEWIEIVNEYVKYREFGSDVQSILRKYILCIEHDFKNRVYTDKTDDEYFAAHLYAMASVTNIPDDVSIVDGKINMLNYNYNIMRNLGGNEQLLPSRMKVIQSLIDVPNSKIVYDNRTSQSFYFTLKVSTDDGEYDEQKFIVHRNGKIAHSGHSVELMKKGYNIVMDALSKAQYTAPPAKIKMSELLASDGDVVSAMQQLSI